MFAGSDLVFSLNGTLGAVKADFKRRTRCNERGLYIGSIRNLCSLRSLPGQHRGWSYGIQSRLSFSDVWRW